MRVQFAPNGVGLGHAGRCVPIARELLQRRNGMEIFFSTYKDAINFLRQEGFHTLSVPPMAVKVKPDGSIDFKRTALNPGPFVVPFNFLGQVGREIEIMETYKPDIVISDSRASPIVAAKILNIPALCILNQFQVIIPRKTHFLRLAKIADIITLTIIGKIWALVNKIMIPDFPPPFTISIDNLRIPRIYNKKVELIGPILPVTSDALPSKEALRKKLNLPNGKFIIYVPISGPYKERSYLVKMLIKLFRNFPNDYHIVMSMGSPESISPLIEEENFTVYSWIQNRFEYMKACDAMLSRAGHGTLLQAISFGKPLILIPTPNHTEQINNARRCIELSIALLVKQEDLRRGTLLRVVESIVKEEYAERATEIQSAVSNLNGRKIAVEHTLKLLEDNH